MFAEAGILGHEATGSGLTKFPLTPKGSDFRAVTTMINAWTQRWLADDGQSGLSLVHRACG